MRTHQLGDSDLLVSRVGLGCNNFGGRVDFEGTREVVAAALEVGITFFDTADIYGNLGGSESFLGKILKGRRSEVVLATKFSHDMNGLNGDDKGARGSRDYIRRAIAGSLERLQTDYIDLYYYHRPDGVTPLAETLGALDELVREGKVRHIGCSNFTAEQLTEAVQLARTSGQSRFVAVQNRLSLLEREGEEDVLRRCREYGIGYVPYFPLASGLLTGKYRRGRPVPAGARLEGRADALTDDAFEKVERLERLATDRGHTLLELAISGLASQPEIASVIAGATKPEQVRANAAAAEWELSQAELEELAGVD